MESSRLWAIKLDLRQHSYDLPMHQLQPTSCLERLCRRVVKSNHMRRYNYYDYLLDLLQDILQTTVAGFHRHCTRTDYKCFKVRCYLRVSI